MRLLVPLLALASAVPVFVMMPLDTVSPSGVLKAGLQAQLQQLQGVGVDGVMVDMWWGVVERNGPKNYDFGAYIQLFDICKSLNLRVAPVASFHQCGGNVGDTCDIPLPSFVRSVGSSNPDIYYKDAEGHYNPEYLSWGVDDQPLFGGRSPVQMYSDFLGALKRTVLSNYSQIVDSVQISLGPAGELRYPSYPLQYWQFCGIGEFQAYDKYMLADLRQYASDKGHPEWGNGPPNNAGTYNDSPSQTGFFGNGNDNYASNYGQFFMTWYSNGLLSHGAKILKQAQQQLSGFNFCGKVAGIHWWYKDNSHAAELTAGYYNTNGQDAYGVIADMFRSVGAGFDFTCFEMKDSEQPASCASGPQELVSQTKQAALGRGIHYAGENALPRYDTTAYAQIQSQASGLSGFYYLRLGQDLLNQLGPFKGFVGAMHGISHNISLAKE